MTIEEVARKVEELVSRRWTDSGFVILVSELGSRLTQEERALIGVPFARRLTQIADVRLLVHPTIPEKIGVISSNAEIPNDAATIFAPPPPKVATSTMGSRFSPNVWRAFQTPIEPGKSRFLIYMGRESRVVDLSSGDAKPDGAIEIPEESIFADPFATNTARFAGTLGAINAWCGKHNIKPEDLMQPSPSEPPAKKHDHQAPFDSLFSKLTSIEQARIFIPLDLVLKMRG